MEVHALQKPANLFSSHGNVSLGGVEVATSRVLVGTRGLLLMGESEASVAVSWIDPSEIPRRFCQRSFGSKMELLASLDISVEDIDTLATSLSLYSTSFSNQPGSDLSAVIAGSR